MKKVIYTCITNGYDKLIEPLSVNREFDYICFVKKGTIDSYSSKIWSFREIPFDCNDNRVLSRYVKINPHKVLFDYDYSLYIDGNVSIAEYEVYDIINQKIDIRKIYSGMKHWGRDCAYDEAFACLNAKKESFFRIVKTVRFLKSKSFPKHYGLYENNVIFRAHNESRIIQFSDLWWDFYLKYSRRDQLFHSYCLKECNIEFDYLIPEEFCARNYT
jgi:hypothetical protein